MRVLFVDQAGDAAGGAQQSLSLLLGALPKDVARHAILFRDGAFAQHLREGGVVVEIVPLSPELLRATRERPGVSGILSSPQAIIALATAIRRTRADLVYTNTIKAHLLAAPAARISGVPCVAHLRDILQGPARTLARAALQTCTVRRIAISHAVREAFALSGTDVIFNPVNLDAYRDLPDRKTARRELGIPEAGLLVSLIGRINRWKGHDVFVRLVECLRTRKDVQFAVIGAPLFRDADFLEELKAHVIARGLEDRLHFVPWLNDARVAYAASDIVCNCSTDEPFGRTLIEAAAAGVPTVCFASGGTRDAVIHEETGLVVPADDEVGFHHAIERLIDDPDLRARLGEGGRIAADRFDAGKHAQQVMRVLENAVA